MHTLPATSERHYLTGRAALNVPNEDNSFADWHFDEVFLSGRGRFRVAGQDFPDTSALLLAAMVSVSALTYYGAMAWC